MGRGEPRQDSPLERSSGQVTPHFVGSGLSHHTMNWRNAPSAPNPRTGWPRRVPRPGGHGRRRPRRGRCRRRGSGPRAQISATPREVLPGTRRRWTRQERKHGGGPQHGDSPEIDHPFSPGNDRRSPVVDQGDRSEATLAFRLCPGVIDFGRIPRTVAK
jgi:hypothetical protein